MSIRMGNVQFEQVERVLGYRLNKDDEKLWNEYHCNDASLNNSEQNAFHIFDMPKCIVFKGKEMGNIILKMFTKDKMVKSLGAFQVYKQD